MPRSSDSKWTKTCKTCGQPYSQRRPKQIYCSRACAEQDRLAWAKPRGGIRIATDLGPRICATCGQEYQPSRISQLACSRKCRDALPEQRSKQRQIDHSPKRRSRQNELRRTATPAQRQRVRDYNRMLQLRRYGLTPEDYDRMLAAQQGRCAICGNPPKPNGVRAASRLHADHDHVTGRVRDLVCLTCNVGIGHFRDDPDLMQAAADYIKRHRTAVAGGK